MVIGILMQWECPSCGNLIRTSSPFWDDKTRKGVNSPERCGCGRKGEFKLMAFEQCVYSVIPKGYKVVDDKGNVIIDQGTSDEELNEE